MKTHGSLKTIGVVAAELSISRWKLAYLIERRVVPDASARVPGRRLFTETDIQQIREALRAYTKDSADTAVASRGGDDAEARSS